MIGNYLPKILLVLVTLLGAVTAYSQEDEMSWRFDVSVSYQDEYIKYKNNYEINKSMTASVGEPMIYFKEVKVAPERPAFTPESDTTLDMAMKIKAGEKYALYGTAKSKGGQEFKALVYEKRPDAFRLLLVRPDGMLHHENGYINNGDRKKSKDGTIQFVAQSYWSKKPAVRMVEAAPLPEQEVVLTNFVIVYMGRDGASQNYEIRNYLDGSVVSTKKVSFDALADNITFKFWARQKSGETLMNFAVRIEQLEANRVTYIVKDDKVRQP